MRFREAMDEFDFCFRHEGNVYAVMETPCASRRDFSGRVDHGGLDHIDRYMCEYTAHAVDESVSVDQLVTVARTIVRALARWT